MANISNLKRHHREVYEIINYIKSEMESNVEDSASNIAKNINVLSGKLRIHLREEDNLLYPKIFESDNDELKKFGEIYQNEMEGISEEFMNYKGNYNTRSKIINNIQEFNKETKDMIKKLENRLSKEDNYLYPRIEKL